MDARWREGLCARVYRIVCVSSRELRREALSTDCADDYPLDRRPYRVTLADVDVIRVMY